MRELPARLTVLAFEAQHVMLPRRARIVVVHPVFAEHPVAAVHMMREACILEALQHPSIPRLYECGLLPDRRPWMALEILDGPSIEDLAAYESLVAGDVLALLRDVATILEHAHVHGVIHRGIRPDSIVVGEHGLQLADWGDSITIDSASAGDEPVDGRGDIFALGIVAHQVLDHEARSGPRAHAGLSGLIDRMLARDPRDRPSATAVRIAATRYSEQLARASSPVVEHTDDDAPVEQVDVVLVDISHDPPPVPRSLKWTPDPHATPIEIAPEVSTPRRKPTP